MYRLDISNRDIELWKKIDDQSTKLENLFYVNWGFRTGDAKRTKELIVETGKHTKSKPMLRGGDRYERSESEKVQRALYQYVKAQIAIDEIGLIGKKELAKFLSAYMVGRAWQTVMEIGKQAHRVSFGSDIGKLLRAQLKNIIETDHEAKYIDSLTAQHFWHAFNIENYTNARRKD